MKKRTPSISLTPWEVFSKSSLICGLLAILVFGLSLRRIEPLPLNDSPLRFDPRLAHESMRYLAKTFPNRVTWGENRAKAGVWLKDEFRKMGYTPKSLKFSEVIAGKQYTDLENIYVEKKGTTHPDEIIVAMAHYDITDTTTEGAMDDASGVGVVLELARIFSKEKTDRTLLFILTDSEEFGAFWGATAFANRYEKAHQIVAAANFDFVAPEVQTKILTLCDGLKTGFTPLWLREIALNSLRSLGTVIVKDMDGMEEFIERAMQVPPADHGAFLAAGIPAFNWVGQTNNFPYVMTHYHHTTYDVAEAIRPESFDSYGKGAERVIRSVDALPKIPKDFRDSSYWKISQNYFIPGWAVTILHILAFIPFLGFSLIKFGRVIRSGNKTNAKRTLLNEAKAMGILLGSLLLGYVVILMLPALRIITLYETFPATQKSLILYNPNFVAILIVLASISIAYWVLKKTFLKVEDPSENVELRHGLHSALLTLVIFLAFLKNSYLAVLLLLPPAYLWMVVRVRRKKEDRLLNGLLLIGGAVSLVAVSAALGTIFHLGVLYWYVFLAAAYGLISAYSVILFFMALTVMIRLFRSFVL